jgi:hypothetical protein
MIIEFQLTGERFEELLRQRIRAEWRGYSWPIQWQRTDWYVAKLDVERVQIGLDTDLSPITLNIVESDGDVAAPPLSSEEVDAFRLQARVFGTLYLCSVDDMKAANTTEPPATMIPILGALAELRMTVTKKGVPHLCSKLLDFPGLPDGISQQQKAALLKQFKACAKIDLRKALGQAGKYLPTIVNAGITATPTLASVAIRLDTEPESPESADRWRTFYGGEFMTTLEGREWALLVPSEIMMQPVLKMVGKQLETPESQARFNLIAGPAAIWDPVASTARMRIAMSGEIIDACVGIDMNVDIVIGVRFRVPPGMPNTMRVTTTLDYDTMFGEELLCLLGMALLWPVFGTMTLVDNEIDNAAWWSFLGVFADWPLRLGGAIGFMVSDLPAGQLPEMQGWTEVSDTERYIDFPFPSKANLLGVALTLEAVTNHFSGAVLRGAMPIEVPVDMNLTAAIPAFDGWYQKRPCDDPFDYEAFQRILFGGVQIGDPPRIPVALTRFAAMSPDPHGQYEDAQRIEMTYSSWLNSGSMTITYDGIEAGFALNPYPLEILIVSSRGVRWLTVPPPPFGPPPRPDTPGEMAAFQMEYIAWKAANCWKFQSIWGKLGVFNPVWLIDPPADAEFARHWFVEVAGAKAGDALALREPTTGNRLASVRVPNGGRAGLALFLPATGENPLATITIGMNNVVMTGAEYDRAAAAVPMPAGPPAMTLSLRQTILVRVAQVTSPASVTALRLDWFDSDPVMLLTSSLGEVAFSLAELARPLEIDLPAGASARSLERVTEPVSADAMPMSASTDDSRTNECGRSSHDVAPPVRDVRRTGRASAGGRRHATWVERPDGTYDVLDVRAPARPELVATYASTPWFVDSARQGKLYARLESDRHAVTLWQVVAGHTGLDRGPASAK